MSETELGREPFEIVEIIVPKCANVFGSAPCTATGTGDAKCFNTRATCKDIPNFQARPLAHLTPDLVLIQGDTIASGDIDRTASVLFECKVTFGAAATGTIWEQGGSADDGAYLGITGADLVFRAGDSTVATGAGVGKVTAALTGFAGRTLTVIAGIDFTASGTSTVFLWTFDPIELVLTKIGEDDFTASTVWAGTDGGGIGINGGSSIPVGEDGGTFNGRIDSARFFEGQTSADIIETADAFRQKYYFDDGRKAKPTDDIYRLPALTSTSTVGTRLNITGADGRYEPLGRRAFMSVAIGDFAHTDFQFDPYLSGRTYDPLTRGTFWPKFQVRNRFGKTRALVRRYTGYNGQALSEAQRQTYVLDKVALGRDRVNISCRDFLSLTEFRKTQVPAQSSGAVDVVLTDVATTLFVAGDVTNDYPATGTLRIGDELMTYTGRAYDGGDDQTDFTGLTRGSDGSTADEHDVDETVQICRRYAGARIDDVLEEFLVTDAEIPAQLVDLSGFTQTYDDDLNAYTLTTIISEPTGADQLIGEMAEDCAFYIWWDERLQQIKMQAIKPLSGVDRALTQENNIIGDTFSLAERPDERLTTVTMSYNPRDFAGDLDKPTNFKNAVLISNANASDLDQYGKLPQTRELFSRWLTTNAQITQTAARLSNRYVEVPLYAEMMIDAKDRAVWVGSFVTLSHDYLLTDTGARDASRRWVVIEAEEIEAGHTQKIVVTDITADGQIYVITENGIGDYTPELFAAGNAFITDNSGLNPDGTTGATIA